MLFCLQLSTESKLALPLEGSGDLFTENGSACRSPPNLGLAAASYSFASKVAYASARPCPHAPFVATTRESGPIGRLSGLKTLAALACHATLSVTGSCNAREIWGESDSMCRGTLCWSGSRQQLIGALFPTSVDVRLSFMCVNHPYPASGTCRYTGRVGGGIDLNPPRTQVNESLQTCSAHAQLSSYSWPIRYESHQVKFCVSCPSALSSGRTISS
jgi:hypothetical protein